MAELDRGTMRGIIVGACALVLVVGTILLSVRSIAAPEPRIALIIGNARYTTDLGPLANPVNDARLMRTALVAAGFRVVVLENADQKLMKRSIAQLGADLRAAGPKAVGLFYYAGHGFQSGGENWLVPVNAVINSEADADLEAVSANAVLRQMQVAGNALNIVILDACRNTPVFRKFRDGSRGLTVMRAPQGSFVAYSTAPGEVAEDGGGANSRYTASLAAEIDRGGDIEQVFKRTRQKVVASTRGNQTPWDSSSLTQDFSFGAPKPTAVVQPGSSAPSVNAETQEALAWQSLGANPSKEELEAFLLAFPKGRYAGIAQAKLNAMKQQANRQPAGGGSTSAPPTTTPSRPADGETQVAVGMNYEPGRTFRDCADCPEMVVAPAGRFTMGSPANEEGRGADEGPQHTVTIGRNFAVGKYEITFAEWDACSSAGACGGHRPSDQGWGRSRRPLINVSWQDAQAYVSWLNNRTGKRYRLLSEAEWEYAARAGTTTPFSFGPTISTSQANYNGNDTYGGGAKGQYRQQTTSVGAFPANRFGLYDMHGNVWEWVEDCWNDSYSGAPTDGRAWMAGDCSRRVLRGGSWKVSSDFLRSAQRLGVDASARARSESGGFRVARTL